MMTATILAASLIGQPAVTLQNRIESSFFQYARHKGAKGGALMVTAGTDVITASYGIRNSNGDPYLLTTPQRIASVSKTITTVAILKLIQDGKARLDDAVLPILNSGRKTPIKPGDQRIERITIRHLLQHTAGFGGNAADAQILWNQFAISRSYKTSLPVPASSQVDISLMKQSLKSEPGHAFSYSNTGFLVLGRLIEKLSGKTYEEYVWQVVLAPANIAKDQAFVGHGTKLRQNESQYWDLPGRTGNSVYGEDQVGGVAKRVPYPMGTLAIETTDAYGGWCMSVTALAQFLNALPKILSKDMQKLVVERPRYHSGPASYIGLGFTVLPESAGGYTLYHGGSLEGCNSVIMYRANGQIIVSLFNTGGLPDDNNWANNYVQQTLVPILNQARRRGE